MKRSVLVSSLVLALANMLAACGGNPTDASDDAAHGRHAPLPAAGTAGTAATIPSPRSRRSATTSRRTWTPSSRPSPAPGM